MNGGAAHYDGKRVYLRMGVRVRMKGGAAHYDGRRVYL